MDDYGSRILMTGGSGIRGRPFFVLRENVCGVPSSGPDIGSLEWDVGDQKGMRLGHGKKKSAGCGFFGSQQVSCNPNSLEWQTQRFSSSFASPHPT